MKTNIMIFLAKKISRTIMLVASCYLLIVSSSAHAFDDFDVLGSDAGLPEGIVVNATGFVLGEVEPVDLNPDADFISVENLDIAGAMLGMAFQDIQELFLRARNLYAPRQRNSIVYTLANDWRFNLDYECRQQGTVIPEQLERCIQSLARARGLLYPAELHLERKSTGETISIFFTSNATDNSVWKIVYQNDVNDLPGAHEKFLNQREKKILAFWEMVLEKYGAPNSGNDKWVSSDNSFEPMMTAFYGKLELTDFGLAGRDAALNVKESRERFKAKPYSF